MTEPPRVVTLLPSATEIVYALGVEPVATSHECDQPPAAAELPAVNRSRVDPTASPGRIDDQVISAERAGGVYEIDLAALERCDPDLVISQGICDVCAVDAVLVEAAIEELGLDCELLTTDPHSLADVLEDIERIGAALDQQAAAEQLLGELRPRVEAVTRQAAGAPTPRVMVLDWTDPVMIAGHWVPEMVEMAGGRHGPTEPTADGPSDAYGAIRAYDPEVLVVGPCGFDLEQTIAHLDSLREREGWQTLTAVQNDRVYLLDGHRYLNRPGPALVDTLEFLAATIHPERFSEPPSDAVRRLPAAITGR